MEGVVNEVDPVCKAVPLPEEAYQSMVSPDPGVAEMVTVPVPHLEFPDPVGADGDPVTDNTNVAAESHPTLLVRCTT